MTVFQPANEQLGYCFHSPTAEHRLGYPQLDVVIRATPTGEHFDPESLTVPLASGSATKLRVTHPWEQATAYRISAGEIIIEDARPAQIKAFTFGGALQISSDARRTICQIASPAPLLEHARQTFSLEEHLIEEVYILFAQQRALQDDDELERKLAAVDPLQLYRACLKALAEKFEGFPITDDVHRRFKHFLREAIEPWQGEGIPTLSELL
jgi:hypothetical protein